MRGDVVPGVGKIAVLRANGLGDLLFAGPALDALRAAYPRAEIVLLGREWHAEFVPGRLPGVDRVVVVPLATGIWAPPGHEDDPSELDSFFAAMQQEGFDLALQLHGGGRYSNPFVRRLGARVSAGLRTPDAEGLDREVPYVYYQSEVFRLLEVVATVGGSTSVLEPHLSVLDEDLVEADACVGGREPLVALQ
ncbi:MAG: glycosyltransferase family 9 protein, partial [Actinomycetota bacterium]|nr:glycosyltransferase family 9 protein [Actinomycetota bacterium]